MTRTYSFGNQFSVGQQGERLIAEWIQARSQMAGKCQVIPLPVERQSEGDLLVQMHSGERLTIEVKTDDIAHKTGNIFVETIGDGGWPPRPGWAYSCDSSWLFYLILKTGELLCFDPKNIRANLNDWSVQYEYRAVKNKTHTTLGLLVPIDIARAVASKVFKL
ncbi:MAG: hypothetical protein AAFY20_23940 [Cyanobacteria bacterium J06639_14]